MRFAWLPDAVTTDVAIMAELTLLWGLDGVVLGSADGEMQRVPFVNERRVRERLLANDVQVLAIDPGLFEGDLEERSEWLNEVHSISPVIKFCSRMGCELIQTSSFTRPASPSHIGELSTPFRMLIERMGTGPAVAIKNGRNMRVMRAEHLLELVRQCRDEAHPSAITASWCPALSLLAGEQPTAWCQAMASATSILRCRDLLADNQTFVPFGSGVLPWNEILHALADAEFDGILALDLPRGTSRSEGLRAATHLITTWRRAAGATEK